VIGWILSVAVEARLMLLMDWLLSCLMDVRTNTWREVPARL
jgi:hypothetical protein